MVWASVRKDALGAHVQAMSVPASYSHGSGEGAFDSRAVGGLVPRGGEYCDHLARSEQRANVVRNGDRVDEDQPLAVVDCVRRHRPFPLGMLRGPVVHALGKHSRMLSIYQLARPTTAPRRR